MAPSGTDAKRRELRRRIVSAVVLAPPVVAAVLAGSPWFDILVAVAAAVLAWEWSRLCDDGRFAAPGRVLAAAVVVVLAISILTGRHGIALATAAGAALLAFFVARAAGVRRPLWFAAGTLYIAVPCVALLWLRQAPAIGLSLVLWLLLVTWATDIGAFVAGRTFGGPRLAPRISPNKTWSGLAGGLAAAAIVGAGFAMADGGAVLSGAIASVAIGILVAAGDLVESAMKRRFHVKDASRLIPGHGGLLDRVDGLLAAAPAAALLIHAGWR